MRGVTYWFGAVAVVAGLSGAAMAVERVEGLLTTDGVTGQESKPRGWVDENVFIGAPDAGFGAGAKTIHQPPGWYAIDGTIESEGWRAGDYALFTMNYDGCPAFSVDFGFRIPGGKDKLEGARLNTGAHYSVMYDRDYKDWGESPWQHAPDFYQTFVATQPHITRIATKLADKSGDHYHLTLNYAVYEVNDGAPSTWGRISPVRSRFLSEGTDPIIHIFWVPYRSDEVVLTPGRTYAVRLWRNEISQSETFALVMRPDKGDGYDKGHLWIGDTPRKDVDGYLYISGGMNGTVVNHAPVEDLKLRELAGGGSRHGQTFKATGIGLAGVDIIYATGDTTPPRHPITFQLYDKPGGRKIGPAKTCYGLPLTFQGRAAAVWKRGEVELEPKKMYYLEWTSPGVNTWKVNEDLPGHAFIDGEPKPEMDLAMSIAEYVRFSEKLPNKPEQGAPDHPQESQ